MTSEITDCNSNVTPVSVTNSYLPSWIFICTVRYLSL